MALATNATTSSNEALCFACQACGANLTLPAGVRTTVCPYCAAPSVVERPPSADRPRPAYAVGFVLTKDRAQKNVRDWLARRSVFARGDFKAAKLEDVRAVYLPSYLYGAEAHSQYRAEIGENYTVTTTDSKGRMRTTTHTEWRALEGAHASYVVDKVVTASRGIPNDELETIEPFDLRALVRYAPAMVAGWMAEEPSLSRDECYALARREAQEQLARDLRAFLPGDKQRNLHFDSRVHNEYTDLTLLPVWVLSARYHPDQPPTRVLVNGQTGKVNGRVAYSWLKISLAALLAAAFGVSLYVWLTKL